MSRKKSARRFDVLAAIRRDPRVSYRELADRLGLRSISGIHHYIIQLEQEGLIYRNPRMARSLEICEPNIRRTVKNQRQAAPKTGKRMDLEARIAMVVEMAHKTGTDGPAQDVVRESRPFPSMHAVKVG